MQKLLQEWTRATAEAQYAEALAYCATPGARARALHFARKAERRAAKIATVLRKQYNVDPAELLRREMVK